MVIDRILGFGALYALAVGAYLAGGPSVRGLAGALPALIALGIGLRLPRVHLLPARHRATRDGRPRDSTASPGRGASSRSSRTRCTSTARRWARSGRRFLGSIALQALVVYYYYNIARALRIPLPLSACFLMVPLCSLVQALPISFNGWGVRESVFIVYFAQVGLPRESAMAFSLVGAGLMVLLSLSGAVVWTSRGDAAPAVEDVPH